MTPRPTSADPAGLLGRTLDGRYHAVAFVGEGDLGFVYRGEQTALRRACALKVLRPEVQRDAARMQQVMAGSQRVARGRIDALVPADDVLTTADRTTLVTPWLMGEDLGAVLRQVGRMSWSRMRDLLIQLGETLAHLHGTGLVFTGLKPSNVFLVRTGEGDLVRLLDVGLSRHNARSANITYMAPEWIAGAEPDASTDMYNLAALAYEALTGIAAFPEPPAQAALLKRVKPPPQMRTTVRDLVIPPQIEALLYRSLDRDPGARPDMPTFLATLRSTVPIGEDSATQFFRRFVDMPGQQHSQSGELSADDHHATGQFRRITTTHAPETRTLELAPAEVTRISTPMISSASAPAPAPAPMEERTQISNPIVPPRADDRTPLSATPAPMPERTRIAEPQARPRNPEPQTPPIVEYRPSPRPFQSPATASLATPPLERTVFLQPIGAAATQSLSVDHPGQAPASPDQPAAHTSQTSRTAMIPGFGGSLLGESAGPAEVAVIAVHSSPPRHWAWWSRVTRKLRRDPNKPYKPGLWARIRGVRVGNLPARRGPTGADKFFRKLAEIPGYIGRGWRMLLRPFGRLTALRSKLSTPLMSLRTTFGRLARIFSRWTGGGA